jgi:RND superfamily putative drug exporter
MKSITSFSLRYRWVVVLAWVAMTVAGVLTLSSATGALTHNQAAPGTSGYDANEHLKEIFGLDGHEQPTVGVLHLPPGKGMDTAAGKASPPRPSPPPTRRGRSGSSSSPPAATRSRLIGAGAALVILAFVFGSSIAVVPLLMALPSITTTFLLLFGLTKLTEVSFLAQYLVALMGRWNWWMPEGLSRLLRLAPPEVSTDQG